MSHVEVREIQAFLQESKIDLEEVDPNLEEAASAIVLGRLANRFDTSTWLTPSTTPTLPRKIVAMLIAAWTYNRARAESTDDQSTYGDKLEERAMQLLGQIADGTLELPAESETSTVSPSFWPTDLATTTADESGWDADGAAPLAFTMGKTF